MDNIWGWDCRPCGRSFEVKVERLRELGPGVKAKCPSCGKAHDWFWCGYYRKLPALPDECLFVQEKPDHSTTPSK